MATLIVAHSHSLGYRSTLGITSETHTRLPHYQHRRTLASIVFMNRILELISRRLHRSGGSDVASPAIRCWHGHFGTGHFLVFNLARELVDTHSVLVLSTCQRYPAGLRLVISIERARMRSGAFYS